MNYGAGTTSGSAGYKTKDKLDINDPYTVSKCGFFLLLFAFIFIRLLLID